MTKTGRPRKEIDGEQFNKLCLLQCTEKEIASWFDVSIDTVERRCKEKYKLTFAEVYAQKKGSGKIALRRIQWETAEAGNVTMQIWLGKQWLAQKDKQEIGITDVIKIEVEYVDSDRQGQTKNTA